MKSGWVWVALVTSAVLLTLAGREAGRVGSPGGMAAAAAAPPPPSSSAIAGSLDQIPEIIVIARRPVNP